MRRTIATWALAGSALLGTAMSHAAGADLAVKGKLQAGACNVALTNGGVVDIGTLLSSDLKLNEFNPRGIFGPLTVSIDCEVPSRIAMRLVDNRPGTHFGGQFNGATIVYGLGLSSGRKIGEYVVLSNQVQGDGETVRTLARKPGAPWVVQLQTVYEHDTEYSFASIGGDDEPAAFKTFAAQLVTFVGINKGSELDLNQDIVTDGSATMELVYL